MIALLSPDYLWFWIVIAALWAVFNISLFAVIYMYLSKILDEIKKLTRSK